MAERLPAGQRWIDEPIVYDIGPVPPIRLDEFRLRVYGNVDRPIALTWEEILAMPCVRLTRDFHCVTTWSVRDVVWEGVRAREIGELVSPHQGTQWVIAHGRDGYTTNVPYADFVRPDSLLAYRMNDAPLETKRGFPLRLVIPALYAWKSAKYVQAIEFLAQLRRGFWEQRGYHDRGDPWREERFRT
jgi:DMSO/TMAO reductase YedYZ molybdopterin-dependent catalytic subunit